MLHHQSRQSIHLTVNVLQVSLVKFVLFLRVVSKKGSVYILGIKMFTSQSQINDPFHRDETTPISLPHIKTAHLSNINNCIAKWRLGASTIGSQLLDGDFSHGWQILATQP